MVKGVNRTVIEVNNTGSRLFEKIVFYVTPEYGNLSAKQLRRAASSFAFNFDDSHPVTDKLKKKDNLRRRVSKRRLFRISVIVAAVIAAVAVALIIIL